MTAINRLMSASRQREREREKSELIAAQGGNHKEFPPTYSLYKVDFNVETRITKIEIQQTQQYRTIERYVTQNYVKYPIYSGWKTKSKIIKKTIKLTNKELERLNCHEDFLISKLCEDIILSIGYEDIYPSWFIKKALKEEYKENNRMLDEELSDFSYPISLKTEQCSKKIDNYKLDIDKNKKELAVFQKKNEIIIKKISKIENSKKSIWKSIITLFLYNYYKSNRRKQKLYSKNSKYENKIKELEQKNSEDETKILELKNQMNIMRRSLKKKCDEILKKRDILTTELNENISKVQSLKTEIETDSSFISLKKYIGLDYQKIIGCYIIHNTQNNKYYVGQSKDVMKRIKQHFRGTIPNNVIFSEDYYLTETNKRDDLFEVKIIPCNTKDELDMTEKNYIEIYDSFNNGYNGTNGNQ